MRKSVFICLVVLLFSTSVRSEVTVEPIDMEKRLVRLTYLIDDTKPRSEYFLFPDDGFVHDGDMDSFRVVTVFDPSTKEELAFNVQRVDRNNAPQLRIWYKKPVPPGGKQPLNIVVELIMPEKNFQQDEFGTWKISYGTSHPYIFVMPSAYYVTYTNQPFWIFEREGKVYLQQRDQKPRMNVVHIRKFK